MLMSTDSATAVEALGVGAREDSRTGSSRARRAIPVEAFQVVILGSLVVLHAFGCRKDSPEPSSGQRLNVLCTFLPVYVMALNVVGDDPTVDVRLMVTSDLGCPHEYALRPADLKAADRANIIVAHGLGMEPFLEDLQRTNPRTKVVVISDDCEVLEASGQGHVHNSNCGHDHGAVNGHVWVSPRRAAVEAGTMATKLSEIDPGRAAAYEANAEAYAHRLDALHQRMETAARGFANRRIVTSHDAFAYLARDLDLEVVATLQAEPGQAAVAHQMAHVVETIKRSRAAAVFFEPGPGERIARTVAREAGVPVHPLNPFNTLAGKPTAGSYEEVMSENLRVLQEALGGKP